MNCKDKNEILKSPWQSAQGKPTGATKIYQNSPTRQGSLRESTWRVDTNREKKI